MKDFSGRSLSLPAGIAVAMLAFESLNAQVTVTTLFSFSVTNGAEPSGTLVQGSDGNFYGTTFAGGDNPNHGPLTSAPGYGTVFRITPDGTLTSLVSFNGTNGINPRGGLVQAWDGSFYGTTWYGGISNAGTIFRVTTNGDLTTLVSFVGTNGGWPQSSLIQGNDGFLYGTTRLGGFGRFDFGFGFPGAGTVFRVSTNGELTTLYSFDVDEHGWQPLAPLMQASDGNFWGTTHGSNGGTIFKITPAGNLSTIVTLQESEPFGGLIQSMDGNFYGLDAGDPHQSPQGPHLIRVSTNGNVTTIFSEPTATGGFGAPVEAPDGNFYGTLASGVCFQATPNGQVNYLASVTINNGFGLGGTLVLGNDGSFYGTTKYDASFNGYGSVFRLTVPSAAAPLLRNLKSSSTNIQFSWGTLVGRSYQVQSSTDLAATNWANVGTSFAVTNRMASACCSRDGDQRFYRVVLLP
jgi:uncharacterized repeat protein (TIGR03803 family)